MSFLKKLGIPSGALLLGAGFAPVVYALKHRGEDGWWLGLWGLPLIGLGLLSFVRGLRRPED